MHLTKTRLILPAEMVSAKCSFDANNMKDFPGPDKVYDRIHTLDSSTKKTLYKPTSVFPPDRVLLQPGERADYLSEFTRAVSGEVILDRRDHSARVQLFAGTKALKTHACKALLDTGSPASFIQEKVWLRMLARGTASKDALKQVEEKTWGGFHGVPLQTSYQVRLNIYLGSKENSTQVVVRIANHKYRLPEAMSWVKICLTNIDGTPATQGQYYIRFGPNWFPQEAIVEAGISEIPLQQLTEF